MESKRNGEEKDSKNRGGLLNVEENGVQKEKDEKGPAAERMTYRRNFEELIEVLRRIPEEDPGAKNGDPEEMRDQEAERRSVRNLGRTDQAVETGEEGARNEVRAVRKGGEIDHVIGIDRDRRLGKSIGNSGPSALFLVPLTEPQYWSLFCLWINDYTRIFRCSAFLQQYAVIRGKIQNTLNKIRPYVMEIYKNLLLFLRTLLSDSHSFFFAEKNLLLP
ncbi:hypothetical protein Y032_0234g3143 [Ancylostoma ceylanicum]|uniref:Uncharacterized protein n=1 Tax=Ancylostoma ceylanicum TaxID=53326 RepID=A0A016SF65_9BILA|nr:hypothetical protein Y032_0234g3143 [Ancylostoma ceylanicum]